MAAALGFPFTAAQWKELERQAMIYKYMMAAVPVPSDLLLPADPTAAPPCKFILSFFLPSPLFALYLCHFQSCCTSS